ncbi:unnamed protein product [Cuscuta europaea]|uniref:Uncharacterized protein n=1 Tax=Cuscuta europaea TaxID=41803 RepID=A0A9P0YFC5_CUSEU|nr:unnamed protein product [Cuscuta europaea]
MTKMFLDKKVTRLHVFVSSSAFFFCAPRPKKLPRFCALRLKKLHHAHRRGPSTMFVSSRATMSSGRLHRSELLSPYQLRRQTSPTATKKSIRLSLHHFIFLLRICSIVVGDSSSLITRVSNCKIEPRNHQKTIYLKLGAWCDVGEKVSCEGLRVKV